MTESRIAPDVLKQALKEALVEMLTEERDTLRGLIAEAIEEIALAEAIQDGRESDFVERDRVFELLKGAA